MNGAEKKYNRDIELLTFVTAGSVDDGKSTLIGRLLYDLDQIYDDQIEAVKKADKVEGEMDFSLFTDGLSAEREQKITIDVAYRYFSTNKRRFIIADVPGHEQYTRNMATGASKAAAALILIDARKGLLPQTKRHLFIATLFGIPHIAIIINKMDMVGYDENIFESIRQECIDFTSKLQMYDLQFIPASSLKGDMIVSRGENMPWYGGRTVMNYLENIEIASDRNLIDFRLPVQYIIRPDQDFRGYAGTIEGGTISVGETVKILPSNRTTTVKEIFVAGVKREYAFNPEAVVVALNDELDISRGDMIVRPNNLPEISNQLDAMICWFSETPLQKGKRYLLKHMTTTVPVFATDLRYKIDIKTLHRDKGTELQFNDIGRVSLETLKPLFFDSYTQNKNTGCFIIIDEMTNDTVGAGVIKEKVEAGESQEKLAENSEKTQNIGHVLWFTGLSGAGKSTIAEKVATELKKQGVPFEHLDGDTVRELLTAHLGFSHEDRKKNVEIVAFAAKLLAKHGVIVLVTMISPYQEQREQLKNKIGNCSEIFVNAPLEVCEARDVKGLYKKARAGILEMFTGIDHPYEAPSNPDLELNTDQESIEQSAAKVLEHLRSKSKSH